MKIQKLFIENSLKNHARTLLIQAQFPSAEICWLENFEDVFGKVRKPYLQKRDNLNLFLAQKKGALIKRAPDAYGVLGESHYYFVHSYNCIYECQYCYLQGYFSSPDLVFFLNHEEICAKIKSVATESSDTTWFHAGEFSDSLALSHLSGELPLLFQTFATLANANLELRTKSTNIQELRKLQPLKNVFVSFSLSPAQTAREIDLRTPSVLLRLKAMRELHMLGYRLAVHFDPMIYTPDFVSRYTELTASLFQHVPVEAIAYLSLGVVRYTQDVFHEVARNYPNSLLLQQEQVKSFDNKIRAPRPTRMQMMNKVKNILLQKGLPEKSIYLCMESMEVAQA